MKRVDVTLNRFVPAADGFGAMISVRALLNYPRWKAILVVGLGDDPTAGNPRRLLADVRSPPDAIVAIVRIVDRIAGAFGYVRLVELEKLEAILEHTERELARFTGDCGGLALRGVAEQVLENLDDGTEEVVSKPVTIDFGVCQTAALELSMNGPEVRRGRDLRPFRSFRLGVRTGQRIVVVEESGVRLLDAVVTTA